MMRPEKQPSSSPSSASAARGPVPVRETMNLAPCNKCCAPRQSLVYATVCLPERLVGAVWKAWKVVLEALPEAAIRTVFIVSPQAAQSRIGALPHFPPPQFWRSRRWWLRSRPGCPHRGCSSTLQGVCRSGTRAARGPCCRSASDASGTASTHTSPGCPHPRRAATPMRHRVWRATRSALRPPGSRSRGGSTRPSTRSPGRQAKVYLRK